MLPEVLFNPPPPYGKLLTGHFRERGHYQTRRPRGTMDWLLIYTVAGAGRFGFARDKGEFSVAPGDAVLLAPGTPHDYGLRAVEPPAVGRWDLLWAHFQPRPDWPDGLLRGWPAEAPGLFRRRLGEDGVDDSLRRRIVSRLNEMHRLTLGVGPRAADLGLNALEEVLLLLDAAFPRPGASAVDERVVRAADLLCQNLARPPALPELARRVGLSPSRLAHLFSAALGRPPARYLEEQRLRRARLLLENTGRTVAEVAAEVGFDNPFYFSLRFKRHAGRGPRAHRQATSAGSAVSGAPVEKQSGKRVGRTPDLL